MTFQVRRQTRCLTMLKFCLAFLLFITLALSEKFRFDNYSLYNVLPKNENEIKLLQELAFNDVKYDFWTEPGASAKFVNIMVSPPQKDTLEGFLNHNGIDYRVAIKNIQE